LNHIMVGFVSLRGFAELYAGIKIVMPVWLGSKYGLLMSVCEVGKEYADKLWFVNGLDQSDVV